MNTPRFILLFTLLVFIIPEGFGQRIMKWKDKNESDDFIEGVYALPVSSSIQLISLHSAFNELKAGENQALYFFVESPKEEEYLLKVQERKIVDFYMLQSKPASLEKGTNITGPWKTGEYFKKFDIPNSNLAATVKVGEENKNYFLPVSIMEQNKKDKEEAYAAVFRLSKSIRSGTLKVFLGEIEGALPDDPIQESRISRRIGGSTFEVNIDKSKLKDHSGWVTVHMDLSPKDSMNKIPYRFFFYHSKD